MLGCGFWCSCLVAADGTTSRAVTTLEGRTVLDMDSPVSSFISFIWRSYSDSACCRPSSGHNEWMVRGSWSDSGCLQGPLGQARQTRLLAGEPMSSSGAHQKF